MASCEKCWKDATEAMKGDTPREYQRLIKKRNASPCSQEEQAGESAQVCPKCNRKTIHQFTKECLICHCQWT